MNPLRKGFSRLAKAVFCQEANVMHRSLETESKGYPGVHCTQEIGFINENSQNANQSRVALSVSAGPRDQDEASRGPVDVHSPTTITVSKRTSVIRRNIRVQNHEAHPVDPSGN